MSAFPTALPTARTPDPMLAPALRWGVIGTGWIAERFVTTVTKHTAQRFVGVASRDHTRSRAFADQHGIARAHGSYEQLCADPEVDVVYVATGHAEHLACASLAVEAGKHVLVEKPLCLDATQAGELVALARVCGVYCAEALWTFFLPKFDIIRQLLDDGVLGDIHTVLADYGEYFESGHRILRADLHGGPLLDLGTYPVSFATWVMGAPAQVWASGQPHPAGVNGQTVAILRDASGNQAVIHTTLFSDTPISATVAGSLATLSLPTAFCRPGDLVLTPTGGGTPLVYSEAPVAHEALYFEAAETARCIAAGLAETPLRPLAASITTLAALDEIRSFTA